METIRTNSRIIVGVLALLGLVAALPIAIAGSLEPSKRPGPTMKTLDEVEPRIPISQSDIPLQINFPGSYYLTEDVGSAPTAIMVNADNVTIDLMGFAVVGPGSGTEPGIYMDGRSNVEIRNGTVRNFGRGIYEGDSSGKNHRVINVRSFFNTLDGIHLRGSNHLVKDCTVSNNGALASATAYGIYAGKSSAVTGCIANDNGQSATWPVFGIDTSVACTVTENTAYDNTDYGIYASGYCLVDRNTTYSNGTNMYTGGECEVGLNVAPP